MGGDSECQAKVHPARIMFYGCVDVLFDLAESDDLIKAAINLVAFHP